MWFRSLLKSLKSRPSVAPVRHSPHRPHSPRLVVEALDDRCLPSTFTVTNLLDSGAGSLREAVASAIDRATTNAPGVCARLVVTSSVRAAAKSSSFGPPLAFVNGSATIDSRRSSGRKGG